MIFLATTGIHGPVTGPPPRCSANEDGDNPGAVNLPGTGQGSELFAVMKYC